jgi:acid phosphatase family membrane protein YuiD
MFKEICTSLLENKVLMIGITGWFVAQILKFIIHSIVYKEINLSRLVGDGGMPSCHSATVTSMAVSAGCIYGLSSFEFAITTMVAIIVMHDAMGVRLETGKQAKIINELTSLIEQIDGLATNFSEEKLKEFVGHTPLQVCMGFLLGVLVACLMMKFVY